MENAKRPFQDFVLERPLRFQVDRKECVILGHYKDNEAKKVIISLEKTAFENNELEGWLLNLGSPQLVFENDIYRQYIANSDLACAQIRVNVIDGASEADIAKYSSQKYVLIHESPEMYQSVTKAYIDSLSAAQLQWIYNILEGTAEAERVIYKNPDPHLGFILLPDSKWDLRNLNELHYLAIVMRRDLHSLRDVTTEHIELLRTMEREGREAIAAKHPEISMDRVVAFCHYHPSFFHFHLHFGILDVDGKELAQGRAHFVNDIVDNLQTFGSQFYQKKTIPLVLPESYKLLGKLSSFSTPFLIFINK